MKQEYFELGQIVNHFGIKGMVKVNPFTDDISQFEELESILVEKNGKLLDIQIEEVKYSKNQIILKLKGIDTVEEAEKYRGCYIKIARKNARKLPEDTYFIADLLGLDVFLDTGEKLGILDDIFNNGSTDIYVVKNELGKQFLLPYIDEVIKNIDLENEKIIVHIIDGLI